MTPALSRVDNQATLHTALFCRPVTWERVEMYKGHFMVEPMGMALTQETTLHESPLEVLGKGGAVHCGPASSLAASSYSSSFK